ncbi:Dof zinc finger protein DOF5.4 [Clarias magur]|uniref:Dof zinc finger protein DOF5.4 n=1 Tax=Clarias magur TaxID=1594786 RepID=A0A8J4UJB3_CLAMG|nr:Dof zinc finger protein DOF5.4 [Clarias magur]
MPPASASEGSYQSGTRWCGKRLFSNVMMNHHPPLSCPPCSTDSTTLKGDVSLLIVPVR